MGLIIDLYAGCGGFSLGLEMAGLPVNIAVDIDPQALLIHYYNSPFTSIVRSFVKDFQLSTRAQEIGVDLLVGSPPCQGFSQLGKRDSKDVRNAEVQVFFDKVSEFQPRYFVMENVPWLFHNYPFPIVDDYEYVPLLLDANDYDVPQVRKRTIVVGWKHGMQSPDAPVIKWTGNQVANLASAAALIPGDWLDELNKQALREWSGVPTNNRHLTHQDSTIDSIRKRRQSGQARQPPRSGYVTNRVCHLDLPSPTITANYTSNIHPIEDRRLNNRECARLQSFPDWFVFSRQMAVAKKQIGNSVPPYMARAIAATIAPLIQKRRVLSYPIARKYHWLPQCNIREAAELLRWVGE